MTCSTPQLVTRWKVFREMDERSHCCCFTTRSGSEGKMKIRAAARSDMVVDGGGLHSGPKAPQRCRACSTGSWSMGRKQA
jgi:hypothetical protein